LYGCVSAHLKDRASNGLIELHRRIARGSSAAASLTPDCHDPPQVRRAGNDHTT
jgi:hypothetical protein